MPRLSVGRFSGGGKLSAKGRQIMKEASQQLRIGILEGATYMGDTDVPAGTPVASIAVKHEYGDGKTPPRPFLGPTADAKRAEWIKIFKAMLKGRVANGKVDEAFEVVGQTAAADVTATIETMTTPELAPYTVEKKRERGRSDPEKLLVDSGTMEEAVSFDKQPAPPTQGRIM